ncbi:MAG: WbqC family protein [Candidatus Sulfotelmatobacter sp.]
MRVAISQPTYLPWLGYLDLIDQVDTFVFLDTVQFEKRSWQQRNRIKVPGGLSFLTVPVVVKGRFEQRIKDVQIESPYFARKHLRSIETSYRRAPFFARYFAELAQILETSMAGTRLADLNVQLIQWLCRALGVTTPLLRSSEIHQEGCRSELLLNLCRGLSADSYLSALGSADYLLDDIPQFSAAGIEVIFQHYEHPLYGQQFPPFSSHASAIDLIFNEGGGSLEILRSGRKAALRPAEARLCGKEEVAGA